MSKTIVRNPHADARVSSAPALTITVSEVRSYGRLEYQPECDSSRVFVKLLGQAHLSRDNVALIKKLGFKVLLKGGEL